MRPAVRARFTELMPTTHVLLLLTEAALTGTVVLALFALRRRIGLAPLYLVVGAFQYLQIVLATLVRVEIAPGFVVDPGTVVLFPVMTFVVLLTYIEQDATETRKLAYGVVIANLAAYGAAAAASWHLAIAGHAEPPGLPVGLFTQSPRLAVASTAALFVDVVSAVVIFEAVSRWWRLSLFLRLWLTAAAVMAIDNVLFASGAFLGRPDLPRVLVGGFVGKLAGATFYAALIALYVRFVEPARAAVATVPPPQDLFHWLTYRQRYEAVRSQLSRDALTGLYNRGYFDEFAPQQIAHALRAGHSTSLVLVDVDALKATNDGYGHQAGDALVKFVAEQVGSMVRASDAACRYGGDEFVVVLTNADAGAVRIFADRLLALVTERSKALRPAPPWAPVRVTIGVATVPVDGRSVAEVIARADERLYRGKRQGGARVVGA